MKFLKSRMMLGVLCIILAGAIAFLLLPKLNASKADTVMALSANTNISAGTIITKDMVRSVEIGSYGLPADVVLAEEEKDIIGTVASERIYRNEYLWESKLVSSAEYEKKNVDEVILPEGQYLMALAFPSTSSAIAGVLRADATVDAYQVKESPETGLLTSQKVLPNLHVNRVLNSSLQSLDDLDAMVQAEDYDDTQDAPNFMPAFVIFEVDEAQSNLLIQMEREGSLHLTLVRGGDAQ